jgi:hypothetical protein
MTRSPTLAALLLISAAAPLAAQTKDDTLHLRSAVGAWVTVRNGANNRVGLKDTATSQIKAESTLFKSRAAPPPVVANQPPVVGYTFVKNDTTLSVTFTAAASDPEGSTLTYRWNFGDGTTSTTARTTTHKYGASKTYNSSLTVTDTGGLASSVVKTVTLVPVNVPPVVDTTKPPVDTTKPPPQPLGVVESITGPLVSVGTVSALGGVFDQYEKDFPAFDEGQWAACGPKWDCINYYDRSEIYYAWWKRTGDAKYLPRANAVALDFRTNYLEANNYGIAHHWAMCDGVALHYLTTGDARSQLAIARVGENFAWQVGDATGQVGDPSGYFTTPTDFRINAYAIKCLLDAYIIKAPSNGQNTAGWPAVPDWGVVLRTALNKILKLRDADGQWRGAKCTDGRRVSHPFTNGLLYDALLRYYTQFEPDPRIPAAVKGSLDILWRDDWIAASSAFKYVGESCGPEGTASPAADLNQLILNGYAFVGKVLGDATSQSRANAVFAGGVNGRGVTGDAKHFNQQYTSSYRYFAIRTTTAGVRGLAVPPYKPKKQPLTKITDDDPTPPPPDKLK